MNTAKGIEFLRVELAKKRSPRILIVEDDKNDFDLLSRLLTQFHCEYIWASMTDDAVKLIEEDGISLVLLDLKMPVVPGIDVLTRTKALDPNMHFVVVTGAHGTLEMEEAVNKGAVMILGKPVTYDQLAKFLTPKTNEGS